ncbi:pheromone-regulated protein PRM1 Ecym_1070 [Eremothecium cymbalariae DBVPG|uniref:Plasma membrane fusion protein PRM1 n=1 Tax=Eremothecium cymbalariae (strain CBS 270.75 / DBVPG 7215 / KCTC 17166 / NRRL Y-17582) TaxID=931890 RepID=G8JMB9_ERECY|nr:hypothetical protein Ecym_1070 [Eremothecium cymbalariae DBVPG\
MTYTKPYLELRERLSQIWINRYTLLLLLCLVKLLLFAKSLHNSLNQSEEYILDHCFTIDHYYNTLRNGTPHYMGKIGNYLITKSLEGSVDGLLALLSLLVLASEAIIVFMIELWLGTYACLLVSAVHGAVDVATNATEKILGVVNSTVIHAANDLDNGLDGLSKIINKVLKATTKIGALVTDSDDDDDGGNAADHIKKVNLTIAGLRNLQIPSSVNDKLQSLSGKTPDFETLKNKTKQLVSVPFKTIRTEIKNVNTTGMLKNKELVSIPPINIDDSSGGICSAHQPDIEKLYAVFNDVLKYTLIVFIVVLVIGALIVLVPAAWQEYRQWSRLAEMRERAEVTEKFRHRNPFEGSDDDSSDSTLPEGRDVIECYQGVFHRIPTVIGEWIGKTVGRTPRQKKEVQWFMAYIMSPRALIVFAIAMAGILVCVCQLLMIHAISRKLHSDSTKQMLSNMQSDTHEYVSRDMSKWVSSTNDYINGTENSINDEMFGWISSATTSVNSTVNTILEDIDSTVSSAFNGTILYKPMNAVVACVIGNKLRALEKALTWVHDKAHVSLPRINGDELNSAVTDVSLSPDPDSDTHVKVYSRVNNNKSKLETSLAKFTVTLSHSIETILEQYKNLVKTELFIALAILGVWLIQTPIAACILYYKRLHTFPTSPASSYYPHRFCHDHHQPVTFSGT